jgi:hypothetical protein
MNELRDILALAMKNTARKYACKKAVTTLRGTGGVHVCNQCFENMADVAITFIRQHMGCARGQNATQFCQEAVAAMARLRELEEVYQRSYESAAAIIDAHAGTPDDFEHYSLDSGNLQFLMMQHAQDEVRRYKERMSHEQSS